jgi:hypothetical protein
LNVKNANSKARTKIDLISVAGFVLNDEQLRLVGGGKDNAPTPAPHKCWQSASSVVNPGEQDTMREYVVD